MIQKTKTRRELDSENKRGKKRFLERKVEEHEADEQIREFDRYITIEDREEQLIDNKQ